MPRTVGAVLILVGVLAIFPLLTLSAAAGKYALTPRQLRADATTLASLAVKEEAALNDIKAGHYDAAKQSLEMSAKNLSTIVDQVVGYNSELPESQRKGSVFDSAIDIEAAKEEDELAVTHIPDTPDAAENFIESAVEHKHTAADLLLQVALASQLANTHYSCGSTEIKAIDTWNGGAVTNGGTPSEFDTDGPVCFLSDEDYHYNNGQGAPLGYMSIIGVKTTSPGVKYVGPLFAQKSSGSDQGWVVTPPSGQQIILDGTYRCEDSDPSTWSSNAASKGAGFCLVYVAKATPTS
jgi:hypothetical protein